MTAKKRQHNKYWRQTRLYESAPPVTTPPANIEHQGDPLPERWDGDGIICLGYQNVRGMDMYNGLEVSTKIDMMRELGINIHGLSECNRP